MRYMRRSRRKQEEVAPLDRVRQIATLDAYEGANPDDVIRRIRSMTYGSTSSEQVKLRLAASGAETLSTI
jgi:hypothetical protein